MNKISAIGFDWNGVILQYPGGSFNDAAALFLGVENERFRQAYFLHNHMVNKGKGVKGYEEATEMWTTILSKLEKKEMLGPFLNFIKEQPTGIVSQQMLELLKDLRDAGWKLGLFSNHSIEGAEAIRRQGYDRLFDVTLFSSEIGHIKPEPEAFLTLATKLGVPVTELVFIDDSPRSLSTADEVGYHPILFKDAKTLIGQLNALGIAIS